MNAMNSPAGRLQTSESSKRVMTQFQVYENLHFVSDLCFEKGRVTIGSSRQADLFLDHQSVAGIHALVDIKNGDAILTNQFPENGLRLNGEAVLNARLQHEDVIAIGPFALKIKNAGNDTHFSNNTSTAFYVRLINQYKCEEGKKKAASNLSTLLKLEIEKAKVLIDRDSFIIKKGISCHEAAKIQNTMLKAGIICIVQREDSQQQLQTQTALPADPVEQTANIRPEGSSTLQAKITPEKISPPEILFVDRQQEEEDEEDLWEAPFSLENKVRHTDLFSQSNSAQNINPISWRHWTLSTGVHLAVILFFFLYTAIQTAVPQKQALHFVKIDRSMLKQMKAPKPKTVAKKKPVMKAESEKPIEKEKPKKTKPAVKRKASSHQSKKVKRSVKKTISASATTKHPKAGGGFGDGNIKNRNVNQTGLLSVLGGTSPTGTSKAMVAVTNLDAVKVPGATEKNFSVGGLKGALGNGKLAVATGPIVQTKGSTQVLRSAGVSGTGEVAALAKGSIGKKQVQAMVTAKLNRTVKIEGGMSREMVKKVIDQHLDEITYCYETALMSNPSILGRVVFEWKILKSGRVGQVRIVSSSVNSNQIHSCIKTAIQSWQFPKPVGTEVIVSYPFVFDLVSF